MRDMESKGEAAMRGRHDQMIFKSPPIVLPRLEKLVKQVVLMRAKIYKLEGIKIKKMLEVDQIETKNSDGQHRWSGVTKFVTKSKS